MPTTSLIDFAVNERVLVEIIKGIYGLPQAALLAKQHTSWLPTPIMNPRHSDPHIFGSREVRHQEEILYVSGGESSARLIDCGVEKNHDGFERGSVCGNGARAIRAISTIGSAYPLICAMLDGTLWVVVGG